MAILKDDQAAEKPMLGAPKTSTAFTLLFNAAANNLNKSELEYLAGLTEHAQIEAENIAGNLDRMAVLISSVEKIHQPGGEGVGQMLWSLSNQLDHIAGLISVSSEAAYQLEVLRAKNTPA